MFFKVLSLATTMFPSSHAEASGSHDLSKGSSLLTIQLSALSKSASSSTCTVNALKSPQPFIFPWFSNALHILPLWNMTGTGAQ